MASLGFSQDVERSAGARCKAAPILAALTLVMTAGCRSSDQGDRAPFEAEAPQAEGETPAEEAPAEVAKAEPAPAPPEEDAHPAGEGGVDHVYGTDRWPCSGHRVCEEGSPDDGALQIATTGVAHIDPSLVSESAGMRVVENLFEGLLAHPLGSGPPAPGVAESWEVSDDGTVYTFHLRDDARWSNGRPVVAEDFVYSWTRKLDPATASQSAENLWFIEHAKAFNTGELEDPSKLGLEAPDEHTLVVTLERPTPFWIHYVKGGHYAPVPREAVEAHGKQWTRPEHIVTNGPYHLAKWVPRDVMVLERSETWREADTVSIPKVVIHHSESESQNLRRYESGQTHWVVGALPSDKISLFMEDRRPDLFVDPFLAVYFYSFRVDQPPMDDPKVRRAVDMAIDKERLVTHVTRGMQQPADGPVPPYFEETLGYPKPAGNPFDPEAARRLLAEAGHPNGLDLPPVTIVYNTSEGHRRIAEFVQRSLEENLGLEVEIENMEWKSLLQRLQQGDFQVARFGAIGLPDPYDFLGAFRSDSPNNLMGWSNEEFDRLVARSQETRDTAERMRLLAEAERLVQEEVPIAPLYYYTKVYLKKPVLQGFEPELNDKHPFRYMYWADRRGTDEEASQ
ncbi:MAG: peptide ABC transporter substrate-binding protein [Myxococcota bacterium]